VKRSASFANPSLERFSIPPCKNLTTGQKPLRTGLVFWFAAGHATATDACPAVRDTRGTRPMKRRFILLVCLFACDVQAADSNAMYQRHATWAESMTATRQKVAQAQAQQLKLPAEQTDWNVVWEGLYRRFWTEWLLNSGAYMHWIWAVPFWYRLCCCSSAPCSPSRKRGTSYGSRSMTP
jgi:hypothetical protein